MRTFPGFLRLGWGSAAAALTLVACATPTTSDGPSPFDDEHELTGESDLLSGAPVNDSIPDDSKADAVYPQTFDVRAQQSPVKSQGSRGVCSIFATTAQVENLYIQAGMQAPDFSEQYLQWATKFLSGEFTYTDGSSGAVNLATVVSYGTVAESVWPYETQPWTAANDAACAGDDKPTRCFTNGEPPAAAANAEKFKVPSSRWLNTNAIKAHLTEKQNGVVVGMKFFYQSWNHRRSTLPVSTEYWQKGYVTYPNAEDKTESAKQSAGHAIHIIGWDDNLEVVMRDATGAPVLDDAGQPRKEKGFWLFKNSWGTAGFGIANEFGPGYGWLSYRYVKEYGSAVVGTVPVLALPPEVCDDAAAADEDNDGQANCLDTDCGMAPSCEPSATEHVYAATPAAAIPDDNETGVSSVIDATHAGTIVAAKVAVKVTHTYQGDLNVTLVKGDVVKVLHNNTGGSADNLEINVSLPELVGKANQGPYTLKVVDNAGQDIGTLDSWSVTVEVTP